MVFNPFKKTSWKTNIRLLLVLPFVCQILAGLGIFGYLSYRNSQKALEEITVKLRQDMAIRIDNQVERLVENGNNLNQINENQLILDPSLIKNTSQLARYFALQYQWTEYINLIGFVSQKEGNYIEVRKQSTGELELTILEKNKSNALLTYQVNSQGDIIKLLRSQPNFDFNPRQESWYQNTLANKQEYWHQTQKNSTTDKLVFVNSKQVYNSQGELLGIVTNQIDLIELSFFLSSLKIGKTGSAFIIDKQGKLIADSITMKRSDAIYNEKLLLNPATNHPDQYIKGITSYIFKNQSNLNSYNQSQFTSIKVNKKNLLIDVNNFDKSNSIEWLIVLVIPKSDFMDFIGKNNRVTFMLLFLALIIAIISGLVTSKLIVRPIINLQDASQKIAQGDFNQNISLQGIKELDTLANSFNYMTQMLDSFFNDLNKSLKKVSNLKYAIDQSAIVTVTDTEGKIIYCNDKLTEISGYTPQELIGKTTSILKSGYHRDTFYKRIWVQISEQKVWRGEIKNKTKDDCYYWVDTTIVPLSNEEGKLVQYLSIQTEITERKQLEKNLEEVVDIRTQELANANEEITLLNQRLCTENIQMSGKLRMLHEMQQLILPTTEELKNIEHLDIAGYMEPADELGGDYYDVLTGDNTVTIGIGDVTGHGLESGILMVMTQAAICTLKQLGETNPLKFLDILNRTIYYNVKRMNSEKNLSLAIINYFNGTVCISGQHEEVIIVRKKECKVEIIDTIDLGLPIGIDEDIRPYIDHTIITLNQGDGIVLYTDGITEARNMEKDQYGIERLCKVVSQHWHLNSEEIRDIVINDVKKFIGLQKIEDDLTLLLLKQL